jgi:hypothetical protein
VIEQLLIIMDWVPALVWHTSDPYQDSGEPSTRVSRPGGVVREGQSNIKYPEYHCQNKMRKIEEKIQAVVDSKMTTDSEATVYTSARFRYLLYLLQVLPIVITVSFVLRTWRPHIHCRLSRRCGHVCLCEMCEFTLIVCRGNRPSCRGIISTTRKVFL